MKDSTGFSARIALLVVLMILLALVASLTTFAWQHNKVRTLNNTVSSLNTKIGGLNNQLAALTKQVNESCPQSQQQPTSPVCAGFRYESPKGVSVLVFTPSKNQTITSPLAVVGEVPGNWSSEAQFPVLLKDSEGKVITQTPAHLLGSWQTTQLVPFSAQLTYTGAPSGVGTLVLQKDNPSGLLQNSDSVSIPITF